ncbi:hypothetical protein D1007_44016 [Hordeum vulgare]|nr:hypothetical protein D1007_44016 [Hordeum vulgare]
MIGSSLQVVPLRPEEVWQRGLEEHFAQFRADEDADAGRQPCTGSALAEARTRGGMPTSKALLFSSLLVRNWIRREGNFQKKWHSAEITHHLVISFCLYEKSL